MNPLNRAGIHKTGRQVIDNSLVGSNPLVLIIRLFLSVYTALLDLMIWAKMMRSSTRPLNELTLEGLYMKDLEIFYFDFFERKDWERTKETIRCLITSLVLGAVFYLLATYLMDLDLRVRVIATCIVSTLLTLLLSYSAVSRAVTFLMIPSMARGSLRNALLIGSVVLLTAGPAQVMRTNVNAIATSKTCLHEQYIDIVSVVRSLRGRNAINLLLLPVRLILLGVQILADIIFRKLTGIFHAFKKLIETMEKLKKQLERMLNRFQNIFPAMPACKTLTRRLAVRFKRTKVLGGLVQMIVVFSNFFHSLSGHPPFAVPTIGYLIHKIGNAKLCPLLKRAQEKYNEKKRKIKTWFMRKITPLINKVKAVWNLILDVMGSETRVTIQMTGGVTHQLNEVKKLMRQAVLKKSSEVKEAYSQSSRTVQIVCSVLSLVVFGVTLLFSLLFYQRYMTKDDYDNSYITAPFLRLEEIEPPLLPLDDYEKSRVSVLADAMISDIVRRLGGSDLFITLLRLLPFLVVLVLEWVSYIITAFLEETWNKAIELERNVDSRLSIKSTKQMIQKNPMALLMNIIIQVQGVLREISLDVNVLACSPNAAKPNWVLDVLLVVLLLTYTLFSLFGPFFLKLRHHIMLGLEPARAVQRAVWLRREIQSDRDLMPTKRDLLKMSQMEQENSSMLFIFNTLVKDKLTGLMNSIRGMLNLPNIRCAQCGIRGNLSMKNFNDFFTICDSCESSICAPCAHFTDQEGVVKLRERCPNCGLKMEDVDIDAEEIEDEDPLNDMLFNFLDLTPGYKVSRSALEAQMAEARAYKAELEHENERSIIATLGPAASIDPNEKRA